ncbi:HPF/RaiA family ribosome-associated protein [Sediminibacterium roseum]|uniref:HPF/RaiA family ribosome-associated protein n=1 Tax=Sediminibacterium roseum TaxID=1978412 RepID=A0ABW9ZT95_9BACT|nr:HPF/RaiA family ribosome-associated protein [Sediminibacterium roseum]NCI50351.1 HPF/RaiA family ribosome-associated protein [Sediminibacterium roseum]
MEIIIQSLGFKAGESLEGFVREKVNTLKSDRIIRANVTLFKGPGSEPQNDYCEIRLEMPGNDPFVKRHSAYFETAVTECVDVLSENLNRLKSRVIKERQAEANAIQDALLEAEADVDVDTDLEDVVKNP